MSVMNPIRVDATVHHRRALAQARALRRAARRDGGERQRAASAFAAYLEAEVLPRCADHEQRLFPLVVSHEAPLDAVTLALAEHEWLRVLLRRLREALVAGPPDRELLERIALLLVRHVTRETVELMPFVGDTAAA